MLRKQNIVIYAIIFSLQCCFTLSSIDTDNEPIVLAKCGLPVKKVYINVSCTEPNIILDDILCDARCGFGILLLNNNSKPKIAICHTIDFADTKKIFNTESDIVPCNIITYKGIFKCGNINNNNISKLVEFICKYVVNTCTRFNSHCIPFYPL